jgi:hypothetical protein
LIAAFTARLTACRRGSRGAGSVSQYPPVGGHHLPRPVGVGRRPRGAAAVDVASGDRQREALVGADEHHHRVGLIPADLGGGLAGPVQEVAALGDPRADVRVADDLGAAAGLGEGPGELGVERLAHGVAGDDDRAQRRRRGGSSAQHRRVERLGRNRRDGARRAGSAVGGKAPGARADAAVAALPGQHAVFDRAQARLVRQPPGRRAGHQHQAALPTALHVLSGPPDRRAFEREQQQHADADADQRVARAAQAAQRRRGDIVQRLVGRASAQGGEIVVEIGHV